MLSTTAAAACSLLFWVVAARSYPINAVGRAAAEISALTMLASFAQLNLLSVFVRFLASAGKRVVLFLLRGYAAIACASLAMGTGFVLLGLGSGFIGDSWWEGAAFVLAVVVLALFVVQDGVLTAFAKAPWVPVENLSVALVRLSLLGLVLPAVLGVRGASNLSITWAWCAPAMLAVVAVSLVIFGRIAPREARAASRRSLLPPRQELASFILAEYLNNLVTNVMAFVPPLLILYLLGARAAAYFNVPWLIIIVAQTLLWNIGMSFISESTRHVHQIATHLRHTIRLGIAVVVGCTMALFIGAPLILGLQGQEFAVEGVVLLRLLALTFPFTAVVIMYSLVAILERRLWRLVAVNTLGAMTLVFAILEVTPRSGISSVGVIYLIIQAALAGLLLPSLVFRLRSGLIALPEGRSGDGPDRSADTTGRPLKSPVPASEPSNE